MTTIEGIAAQSAGSVLDEIKAGNGLSLVAAANGFPPFRGAGKSTRPETICKWILEGAKAANGDRIRLEAVRVGSRWVTSGPAIDRFVLRLSEMPELTPAPRSPSERNRASDAAGDELARLGC